ncbi:MAG: YchJ family protein [Xanthomonadales bacterium]|nr:YchJ family protein [Xanthomonadales bacterium]MCP5474310.1 YchJ family protein [Rhodanobacteraceae bacterium]
MSPSEPCPCGSSKAYRDCCGRYHSGAVPADAAALMRSRYAAYVRANAEYLLASWHPATRPPSLDAQSLEGVRWLGLSIKRHQIIDNDHALVEFVARSRVGGGSAQRLHEISRFVREDGRWYYVDGEFPE